MRVLAVICNEGRARLEARVFENVFQSNPGVLRAADRTERPLVAARRRSEARTTVAAALDSEPSGLDRIALQIIEVEAQRLPHVPVDAQAPAGQIPARRSLGNEAVVADEVSRVRGHIVIEKRYRRLRVHRTIVQNDEAFFPLDDGRLLRKRHPRSDEPSC